MALGGDDADGDDSGIDSSDELGATPDMEAPEVQSAPDAPGDDAVAGGDDAAVVGDDASQGSDDASGSSSGGSGSSSGSGSSGGSSSGSSSGAVVPPDATPEASVEPDAGVEAASPTDSGGGRGSGTPRIGGGGLRLAGGDPSASAPPGAVGSGVPTFVDDASFSDDAGTTLGGWDGDGAAPPALDMNPPRAILGCAGCSVPDASSSGGLAWTLVALTVAAGALRRRR